MRNFNEKSIGNDLVYLTARRNNPDFNEARYLQKILAPQEYAVYHKLCSDKEACIWLFWSLKEALFKFEKRNHHGLIFNPQSFHVEKITLAQHDLSVDLSVNQSALYKGIPDGCIRSELCTKYSSLKGMSFFTREFVHSVVFKEEEELRDLLWGIKKIESDDYRSQSDNLNSFTIKSIRSVYYPSGNCEIQLVKNELSIPGLFINNRKAPVAISFSHDAYYVGFALLGHVF
jgi:phosphopantetheinyl transferase (holo-ACP synthase)